jgi:drug/metabolite transporter (DMT)-like permease
MLCRFRHLIRSLFSAIVYAIVIGSRRGRFITEDSRINRAIMMRGFLGFCTCSLSFAALITVPLGDSITILLCYAVYANVFARLILKEPLSWWNGFFLMITLSGVILIAHPPFLFAASSQTYDHGRIVGICLNIGASFTFAFSMIVMRTLHGKHVSVSNPKTKVWFLPTKQLRNN